MAMALTVTDLPEDDSSPDSPRSPASPEHGGHSRPRRNSLGGDKSKRGSLTGEQSGRSGRRGSFSRKSGTGGTEELPTFFQGSTPPSPRKSLTRTQSRGKYASAPGADEPSTPHGDEPSQDHSGYPSEAGSEGKKGGRK